MEEESTIALAALLFMAVLANVALGFGPWVLVPVLSTLVPAMFLMSEDVAPVDL